MGGVFNACNSGTGEVEMGRSGDWEVHWPASLTYLVIPRPMRDSDSKTKQQPQDCPTHPAPTKKNSDSLSSGHDVTIAFTREFTAALVPAQGPHRTKPTCSVGIPAGIYWMQQVTKQKPLPTKQRNQKTK